MMSSRAGCEAHGGGGFRIRRLPLEDGAIVVAVAGELDLCSSHTLRETLLAAADSGVASIVVDLSELSLIDSTGLGVLALLARRLTLTSVDLAIVCPEGRISRLLAMTEFDQVLPVYATRGEALRREALARGPESPPPSASPV